MDTFYSTDSSDTSSPHTPSPRMDHAHLLDPQGSQDSKQHFVYHAQPDIVYPPDGYRLPPPQRGGLLSELYDDGPWAHDQQYPPHATHPPPFQPPFDYGKQRPFNPFMPRSEPPPPPLYAEPLPLHPPPHHHPHHMHYDEHAVKLEPSPLVVPTQIPGAYYPRPGSASSGIVPFGEYLPQHPPLPVMHTDDAASKETQYLRRRCHNCHTTEPPSWRRSTLNPGKIVCNKCGLYERTHLRARPQRFDELRASNKARKNSNAAQSPPSTQSPVSDAKPSPPAQPRGLASPEMIKREPGLEGASSDWEDNISVYSSSSSAVSSVPPSVYGSPMTSTYSLSNTNPPSPDLPTPIRLPNAPLTDIMGHGKAFTAPGVPPTPPFWNHGHHGPVARRHTLAGAEQRWPGTPSSGPTPPSVDSTPTDANGRPRKGSMS